MTKTLRPQWIFPAFIMIILLRAVFALTVGYADDDSYHWSWSKDLALSYFDHPGMIAWLEWISTSIFGDTRFGVRLPSFLMYTTTVILIWKWGREVFGEMAGIFSAAMLLFTPLWGFGGHVSSPEQPFILIWILAIMVFWNGVREDGKRWSVKKTWLILGLLFGLGLNSKFPMALLAPGFGLYLLCTPSRRRDLLTPWPWIGVLIACVLVLPVFIWNEQHHWPSFEYQFQQRHAGQELSVKRWFGFLGAQILLLSPGYYVLMVMTVIASFFKFKDPRWRLLLCLFLPNFLIFYSQPFSADYKPHWMGPAYLVMTWGAGALWAWGWTQKDQVLIKPQSRRILWMVAGFLIPMNLLIYVPMMTPVVPKIFRAINPDAQWNPTWDVSNEFFGWPELGEFVLQKQKEIAAESGKAPFISSFRYETTAQTYMATKQLTYTLNTIRSHYTITQQPEGLAALVGQDTLMVMHDKYNEDPMGLAHFDSCEKFDLPIYRGRELARTFYVYRCRNFQGLKI